VRTTLLTVSSSGACPGLCKAQEQFLEGEESREPVKQSRSLGAAAWSAPRIFGLRSTDLQRVWFQVLVLWSHRERNSSFFLGAAPVYGCQSSRFWIRMDRRVLLGGSWSSLKIDPSRFRESRGDYCSVDLLVFWVARILSEYFLEMSTVTEELWAGCNSFLDYFSSNSIYPSYQSDELFT
jgi:hypothetical protein